MSYDRRNGLTFQQWMQEVDNLLYQQIGLTSACLADFLSWDAWDCGMSPEEGTTECMAGDDLFSEMLEGEF